jgi:tyrosine-protein kinase Etk/Wzc
MTPHQKSQLEIAVPEETALPQLFETSEKKHFLDHFIVLAKRKRFIFYFTGAVAVLIVAYSLTMPTFYQATAKLLPPQQGQSFATTMLEQAGSLAPLLGAMGGGSLLKNPNDLYIAMLRSRSVGDDLIDKFSLMQRYKAKKRTDARDRLAGLSEISSGKDNVINIAVEDTDPKMAAQIASAYVDELGALTRKFAVTDAGRRRRFFENEVKDATDHLQAAEDELRKTEHETGIIEPESQTRGMLQAYETLRAQVTAKEYEIASISAFAAPDNPDLVRARGELEELRGQMAKMQNGVGDAPIGRIELQTIPEKQKQFLDKYREFLYRNTLQQLMLKQYQAARVDEAKDFALIQVLDPALPPERKSRPHRAIICISVTFLGFLVACFWSFWREGVERSKEDPQYLARLQLLKFYLRRKSKREDNSHPATGHLE